MLAWTRTRWSYGTWAAVSSAVAGCEWIVADDGDVVRDAGAPQVLADAATFVDAAFVDASLGDAGSPRDVAPMDAACATCVDAAGGALDTGPANADSDAATADAAPSATPACAVQPIPDSLRAAYQLDAFYTRYADADGVPVVASNAPVDEALRRACLLVTDYARVRADVRDALLRQKIRFAVMGAREKTVDIPEFAHLGDIDWRARGLGSLPLAVCAEENILCDRASDRWRGESICVHEFAHTMQLGGYSVADPSFDRRLASAYRAAMAAGLFENTYAASQAAEYFAEGVQDWYDTNLEAARPDGVHNAINTRAELRRYDPALYALLAEVLPDAPSYRDCYHYGD